MNAAGKKSKGCFEIHVFSLLGTILLITFDFKAINLIWAVYPFCEEKMEAKDGELCLEIKTQ